MFCCLDSSLVIVVPSLLKRSEPPALLGVDFDHITAINPYASALNLLGPTHNSLLETIPTLYTF